MAPLGDRSPFKTIAWRWISCFDPAQLLRKPALSRAAAGLPQLVHSAEGLSADTAACLQGMTPPTARKWLGRYLVEGEPGLMDASSCPKRTPRAIAPVTALLIVELRQRRMLQA